MPLEIVKSRKEYFTRFRLQNRARHVLSKIEKKPMSDAALEKPTLESLALEVRQLQQRIEDMEDLMELRAAVERNAGKSGIPWEQVKPELELD